MTSRADLFTPSIAILIENFLASLGDKKLDRDQLFAGAEFQIVTTAIKYCPDSVPKEVTKKVKKILKDNKK